MKRYLFLLLCSVAPIYCSQETKRAHHSTCYTLLCHPETSCCPVPNSRGDGHFQRWHSITGEVLIRYENVAGHIMCCNDTVTIPNEEDFHDDSEACIAKTLCCPLTSIVTGIIGIPVAVVAALTCTAESAYATCACPLNETRVALAKADQLSRQ